MFCSRDYQLTSRFNQQNEKSTSNFTTERQILKSQNPANKPKLGQDREGLRKEMKAPTQVQLQVQTKDENQTREQTIKKTKRRHTNTFD